MMNRTFEIVFALLAIASFRPGDAWVVAPPSTLIIRENIIQQARNTNRAPSSSAASSTTALSAGFGGGGSAQQKKEIKLKPKQQWDRYTALKKETPYKVAVKPADSDDWLEVGTVKSQGSNKTEIAVARQRALIAEVRACAV